MKEMSGIICSKAAVGGDCNSTRDSMDSIIAILGSSTFVGIITLMLNWAQNRKKNSLSYITEERKLWREKIREIAANISKCKYNGENENNIEQYLNQLEMNINPYGRTLPFDYLQDGHIWNTINEINESDSEEGFEQNKKLLLSYLSLMLKEDWERTKREVKGYSNAVFYIAIIGLMGIAYSFFYMYILKLDNMEMFVLMQVIIISPIFLTKSLCIDELNNLIKNDNRGKFRDFLGREKKRIKAVISWVVIFLIYIGINLYIMEQVYPNMIAQQIFYYEDADSLNIYTRLDEKIWASFELDFESAIGKDVEIHKLEDWVYKAATSEKYDDILMRVIRKHVIVWGVIPMMLMIIGLFFPFLVDSLLTWDLNKSKFEIDELKYRMRTTYAGDYDQICLFLNRIDLKNKEMEKENEDCFDLIYRLLFKMKRAMKSELYELDENFSNMEEYERVKRLKKNIENIDNILREIKRIHKTMRMKKKMDILMQIQDDIENIHVAY